MPRAFSSGRRSASTPVSAFTSVVLPWSMWPAVPMIMATPATPPAAAANSASSCAARQRRSRRSAPSAMRPMHRHRQRAQARFDACAARRRACRCGRTTSPAEGRRSTGSEPEPIWLDQRLDGDVDRPAASAACNAGSRRSACGADVGFGPRQQAQRGQALGQAVGIAVEAQHGFERGERELADAQARLSGFFLMRAISSLRPTRCRPADRRAACRRRSVTRSAPAAMASRGVGSCGRPHCSRSASVPLPRSTTKGNAVAVARGRPVRLRARPW